jgi:DUF1680 family protein
MEPSLNIATPVDTSRSPHARLKPVPLTAVRLEDGFWAPRLRINREVTLPAQFRQLEETGRLWNFTRAAGKARGPFKGLYFNDSDVYKWLEAAAWALAAGPDPTLQGLADTVCGAIEEAQGPDGYLNTYFTHERAGERWTNLRDMHELYCAGHFFQAAVALDRANGSDRMLKVACRLADHLGETFGPGKKPGTPGHPEVEMALVELARQTGQPRYLAQAKLFLDNRGRGIIGGGAYYSDHKPFRDLDRLVGHAVRSLYLCAGAADLYAETGETALLATLERLWGRMVSRQLYITGGLGARYEGESFGEDWELPNARAYAETCAAIASVMWNWRMLQLSGGARYADLVEWTLYNGVLPGISLDGLGYFYVNPLSSEGGYRRQPWFDCACCPPNAARTLASLPALFYSLSREAVWIHQYAAGEANLALGDGQRISLAQRTRYPWDGAIDIEIRAAPAGEFSLFLRVPGWVEAGAQVALNGRTLDLPLVPGEYLEIRRLWKPGAAIRLDFPMPARLLESHPNVLENTGRVAAARGPILYCAERADHPSFDLRRAALLPEQPISAAFLPDLLNGVVALTAQAELTPLDPAWENRLYRPLSPAPQFPGVSVPLTLIPYYAWANREAGQMEVWVKRSHSSGGHQADGTF